jgi:DNA-binding transcriptional LysR family regulator
VRPLLSHYCRDFPVVANENLRTYYEEMLMQSPQDAVAWARRLRMRHLESFLVLIEAGTLTLAADRLHMTQSAVSHWLSEMEELVGARLVLRGKQMRLTPAGEAVRKLALRVLGEVSRTNDELVSLERGEVSRLHIGSVTAGIAHLLPRAILAFQKDEGNVAFQVSEGVFNRLLSQLEEREFDLIVGSIDARAYGPTLEHEVLFEDDIAIVVGPDHPLSNATQIDWTDLYAYPWAMPPRDTLMRVRLENTLLERGGAGIVPALETGSVMVLESILHASDYLGVCSGAMARHLVARSLVRRLPLTDVGSFGPVGVVWRRGGQDETLVKFVSILRREAKRTMRGE